MQALISQLSDQQLKLRKVTLFISPLAFFQRRAAASGLTSMHLDVPLKQKELAVDTLSCSKPVTVSYDGKEIGRESTGESLYNFGDMGGDGTSKSKGDILSSLIGSRITHVFFEGREPLSGVIMSCDKKNEVIGNSTTNDTFETKWSHLCLLDSDTFEVLTVEIEDIKSFKIEDQYIQEQLMRSLARSVKRRKPSEKPSGKTRITIKTTSEEEDDLDIGYVGNMKEWRCSYRLSIPKEHRDWSKLEGMDVDQEDSDEISSLATDSKVVLCAFGNVTNSTQEVRDTVMLAHAYATPPLLILRHYSNVASYCYFFATCFSRCAGLGRSRPLARSF